MNRRPKICFMGGQQAGIIGLLTLLSKGCEIIAAVCYSENLTAISNLFKIDTYKNIFDPTFSNALKEADLLISIHSREIVPLKLLNLPRLGGINVHPYLYKYKGAHPIEKALKKKDYKASVGVHKMTERVDEGKVIIEEFVDVSNVKSASDIYNQLYPYYSLALFKALDKIF